MLSTLLVVGDFAIVYTIGIMCHLFELFLYLVTGETTLPQRDSSSGFESSSNNGSNSRSASNINMAANSKRGIFSSSALIRTIKISRGG
ncbi:hypothetical protein NEUTE1DRAFT_139544 [Neurospora tetrasperma FGSC 2508]|uniref:Uncharacterized protein n=1 Tax=Neurospora tetrasperma (strain FGSC 2508 / ATCC MYA-4615 / P0657) TaxID=510951 RepID=F8MTE9_NEUT8|nr:uncharacterized protein NEUTE1DRAFT_139544 [Neurospora tetrasperma FGSC 2508]EGO55281.1 hypothetical protein NEUTE1DRAFT_139544 [Neurospora tetrasperma FGSC 2508]EGZ69499.1 hypothetical protein NEUTE2DRAFT_131899 [Neurospora tetrasperma FGSC 2509]